MVLIWNKLFNIVFLNWNFKIYYYVLFIIITTTVVLFL